MFDIYRKELIWGGRKLVLETGKIRSEAEQEIQTVLARFDVARQLAARHVRLCQWSFGRNLDSAVNP